MDALIEYEAMFSRLNFFPKMRLRQFTLNYGTQIAA